MKKIIIWWSATKLSFWLTYFVSRVANKVHDTLWPGLPVPRYGTVIQAVQRLNLLVWSADVVEAFGLKIKHGWMRSAEWVERKIRTGLKFQTDCDEFAIYAAKMLQFVPGVFDVKVLTLRWVDAFGDLSGHNTCVFSYMNEDQEKRYGTLCNWGLKKDYSSMEEAALFFVKASKGTMIAYATATEDLKFLSHVKYE
jgi:hypothetical protein